MGLLRASFVIGKRFECADCNATLPIASGSDICVQTKTILSLLCSGNEFAPFKGFFMSFFFFFFEIAIKHFLREQWPLGRARIRFSVTKCAIEKRDGELREEKTHSESECAGRDNHSSRNCFCFFFFFVSSFFYSSSSSCSFSSFGNPVRYGPPQ